MPGDLPDRRLDDVSQSNLTTAPRPCCTHAGDKASSSASSRLLCILSSAAPSVELPPPKRMPPLLPVDRAALAHQMLIPGSQPAVHSVTIRAIQLRFRQPSVQRQKSGRVRLPTSKSAHLWPSGSAATDVHVHNPAGKSLTPPPGPIKSTSRIVKRNHPRRPRTPRSPLPPGHAQRSAGPG